MSSDDPLSIEARPSAETEPETHPAKYRLELLFGPMMGGKTSEMQRRLRIYSLYKEVLAVNTAKDTRYSSDGIITHDGRKMQAIRVSSLYELKSTKEYETAEVVGIDEGNFFPEIADFIIEELTMSNKSFIVSALNGDKSKNLFGSVHLLLGHAEKIDFLPALCKRCGDGTTASFSSPIVKFDGQVKIGGSETWEALCRKHHDEAAYTQQLDVLKRSFEKSPVSNTNKPEIIVSDSPVNKSNEYTGC